MKVSRVAEMRALDRAAIERYGIAEALLMENAGHAAYEVLRQHLGISNRRFLILCGIGNNGGDGLVVARKLHAMGGKVRIRILGDPSKYQGAARENLTTCTRLGLPLQAVDSAETLGAEVEWAEVLVDAIFGTGLTRPVTGLYAEAIRRVNQSGKPVLSLDIPSGVNGDSGQIQGVAVQADYTVTFGLPKIGNLLYPGYAYGGQLFVSHISFPPDLSAAEHLNLALNLTPPLPPRQPAGHKGDFGDVLVIAGAASYFGAPYLSAMAFLKAGGGYSRLAAPATMTPFLASRGHEIVYLPQTETAGGSLALSNLTALLETAAQRDMVVLGPGLSLDPETQELIRELATAIPTPLLIDGDGLTALSADVERLQRRSAPTVLTPHLGEMSRLVGLPTADIAARRVDVLQQTASRLNATVVLKGAHSLIGHPDGRVFINLSGNSGMATAGAGDVLTGTIAAMVGLGLDVPEAVRKGVFLHGVAGDLAAAEKGEDGLTAQDILDALPLALKAEREGAPSALQQRYRGPQIL